MTRLTTALSGLPESELEGFADRVAKAVFDLDTQAHFRQPVSSADYDPDDVDEDLFVAVRCAVVASGQSVYEQTLAEPAQLSQRDSWPISDAENLLHAADVAYQARTGESWTYAAPWYTETGDNAAGWPPDANAVQDQVATQPLERVRVDFGFVDDKITRLSNRTAWYDSLQDVTERALRAVTADRSLMTRLDTIAPQGAWLTVDFIGAKTKPANHVKRRGGELEIQMGRHLTKPDALDEEQFARWLESYVRDSLELALGKFEKPRS